MVSSFQGTQDRLFNYSPFRANKDIKNENRIKI